MKKMVFLGLIVLSLGIGVFSFYLNQGYKISITNNTDVVVSDLELSFEMNGSIETRSEISPNETWDCIVDTRSIEGEDIISLYHTDSKGKQQTITLVPYLEHGTRGNIHLSIESVKDHGEIETVIQ